jgi:hypothetical protein
MSGSGTKEYTLRAGQEVTVEDRWDPLAYTKYIEVHSGRIEFKHTFEPPPWYFHNSLGVGTHQIVLPPGYNKLVFRGLSSSSFVRYR